MTRSSAVAVIANLASYQTGFSYNFRPTNWLVHNPILPGRVYECNQTQSTQAWLTKVHVWSQSITVPNMIQTSASVVVCHSVSQKNSPLLSFNSFISVNFVAKQYILQYYSKSVWKDKSELTCYEHTGTTFSPVQLPWEPKCTALQTDNMMMTITDHIVEQYDRLIKNVMLCMIKKI